MHRVGGVGGHGRGSEEAAVGEGSLFLACEVAARVAGRSVVREQK